VRPESKIHALLATARIANVPSVLSNLGVGVFLGGAASGGSFEWPWLLMLSGVLLYIAGNFLNDWADRDWDKTRRPERALPQGMFPSWVYLVLALGGLIGGSLIAGLYGSGVLWVSLILVGMIVLYTVVHKKTPLSVVPMGLCRACLPLMGYLAMRGQLSVLALYPALALFVYIVALSLSARWESMGNIPLEKIRFARGLLVVAGLIAAALPMYMNPMLGWIGLIPFGIWLVLSLTKFRSPVSAHVSALLAGIPWVDWIPLLPMSLTLLGHEKIGTSDLSFWIVILLAPVSFVLGRLLQRVASAT
jgi:heme O synthase-like polyprenyltransferase